MGKKVYSDKTSARDNTRVVLPIQSTFVPRFKPVTENKDEKTLNILLLHWVNHNESHEEGFREWVDKARAIGKEETAINIEKAIEYMRKVNEMLLEAKKSM